MAPPYLHTPATTAMEPILNSTATHDVAEGDAFPLQMDRVRECIRIVIVAAVIFLAIACLVYACMKKFQGCECTWFYVVHDQTGYNIGNENGEYNGHLRNGHPEYYPLSDYPTGPHPSGYPDHVPIFYTPENPPAAYLQSSSSCGNGFDLSSTDYAYGRLPPRYTTRPLPSGNGYGLPITESASGTPPPRYTSQHHSSGQGAGTRVADWSPL